MICTKTSALRCGDHMRSDPHLDMNVIYAFISASVGVLAQFYRNCLVVRAIQVGFAKLHFHATLSCKKMSNKSCHNLERCNRSNIHIVITDSGQSIKTVQYLFKARGLKGFNSLRIFRKSSQFLRNYCCLGLGIGSNINFRTSCIPLSLRLTPICFK